MDDGLLMEVVECCGDLIQNLPDLVDLGDLGGHGLVDFGLGGTLF